MDNFIGNIVEDTTGSRWMVQPHHEDDKYYLTSLRAGYDFRVTVTLKQLRQYRIIQTRKYEPK